MGYTLGLLAYFQSSHQRKDLQNNPKKKNNQNPAHKFLGQ